MPYPTGTIGLANPIGTTASSDVHATHYDFLGNGGFRIVATLVERDAITLNRRAFGMMVYVRANDTYYRLANAAEGGASNDLDDDNNWEVVTMSGEQGPQGPQGEPGETGPMGPSTPSNLIFQGYYNSGNSYVYGDVVMYPPNGTPGGTPPVASYVVMGNNATGAPLNQNGSINTAGGWAFFATAGPAGVDGATGPMGPQGVQGEDGTAGDNGTDGAKWYTGDVLPGLAGITDANNGDLYLYLPAGGNTEEGNGNVYTITDGDWDIQGNIQGPDGTDGGGVWPYAEVLTTASIGGTNGFSSSGQSVEGMTAFEILKKLLFPYLSPTIPTFVVYDNAAGTTNDEQELEVIVGTQLSGNRWFRITTTTASNFATSPSFRITQESTGQPSSYIYGTSTTYQPVPASNTVFNTSSPITIQNVGFNTAGSFVKWRASALTNQTPGLGVTSPFYTVYWRYPVFWGSSTSTSLDGPEVLQLSNRLSSSENGAYSIPSYSGSQYIYFCYPDSGDEFGTFTAMNNTSANAPAGSLALINTVNPNVNPCTACTTYTMTDSTGRYYKPLQLNINGLTVNYRLFRSLNPIAITQFTIVG